MEKKEELLHKEEEIRNLEKVYPLSKEQAGSLKYKSAPGQAAAKYCHEDYQIGENEKNSIFHRSKNLQP